MEKIEVAVKWKVLILERRDLTKKGAYAASLMGSDGFLMDTAVLWHHIGKVRERPLDHVEITLMGRFKGDTESSHTLQFIVNDIDSKLKVRRWLERLNNEFISQGQRNGYA